MKKTVFTVIGAFLQKEVTGLEKTVAQIGAFLKKDEPQVEKILATVIADYKAIEAAVPLVESALTAAGQLIIELSTL